MIRAAAFTLVLAAMAACMPPSARNYALANAVRTYTEGVRWERFEAAAAVVPPAERGQFLDERDLLAKDLRITGSEILQLDERGPRAAVTVKHTWYLETEGTVHETVAAQAWERHGKAWRLVDEYRSRGHEMPGLRDREGSQPDDTHTSSVARAAED
ncbi:MAG: hypothetical protein R3B06_10305 [Kofleriaceae bacterium]